MTSVIFVKKSESNIALQTTVRISGSEQIHNIYKYTVDGCEKYLSIPENMNYIGYNDKGDFYIINLKNDEFDEGILHEIDIGEFENAENKIMYFKEFPPKCEPHINLDGANAMLNGLNDKLNLKCENYQIQMRIIINR